MNRRQIYVRLFVHLLCYLLIALACIFILPGFVAFFLPFVLGWIISMLANPLVRFLEKHIRIVRKHGSMLVIIGTIAIIGAAIYGLGVMAFREISSLIEDLPQFYEEFKIQLSVLSDNMGALFRNIPSVSESIQDMIQNMPETVSGVFSNTDSAALMTATHAFHSVADVILAVIMVFLSAYFFIVERDNILKNISVRMPEAVKRHVDMITDSFRRAIGGYFRAQLKLAFVVFLILYVGFKLINVKYSCLLAVVVAVLDFLPVFGTGFVIWPWALVDLLVGEYVELAALLVIYALCQLIKQLLQPKMVGDSIGMAPLVTLIFLYSGYKIGGFLGMLIGIPVGMVLLNFYQAGFFDVLIEDIRMVSVDLLEHYWKK